MKKNFKIVAVAGMFAALLALAGCAVGGTTWDATLFSTGSTSAGMSIAFNTDGTWEFSTTGSHIDAQAIAVPVAGRRLTFVGNTQADGEVTLYIDGIQFTKGTISGDTLTLQAVPFQFKKR